ncbi:MAG: MOSC N-terminal beta barrel domain-containing protein [Steroidobacteraceae bacterium]|jgi:hypothetical protein|nr:MOSC N-terminal beta barrel domain-containing protein [Steroidobacteraceae bacterium]
MTSRPIPVRLRSLHLYPVKSCHRIDLAAATLGTRGLEGDREWMVTTPEGRFLTQRSHPALACIRPERLGDALRLHCGALPPLEVPAGGDPRWPRRRVRIWNDEVEAAVAGEATRGWLRAALGVEADLVRRGAFTVRSASGTASGAPEVPVDFPDAYPLLVCNVASLEDLNGRLEAPLPMTRFRPNLVIEGLGAYEEDGVATLRFGDCELALVKPCTRCTTTTIDQEHGVPAGSPLEALKAYRWDRTLRGVTFGQNAAILRGSGRRLQAGMPGVALPREDR